MKELNGTRFSNKTGEIMSYEIVTCIARQYSNVKLGEFLVRCRLENKNNAQRLFRCT